MRYIIERPDQVIEVSNPKIGGTFKITEDCFSTIIYKYTIIDSKLWLKEVYFVTAQNQFGKKFDFLIKPVP